MLILYRHRPLICSVSLRTWNISLLAAAITYSIQIVLRMYCKYLEVIVLRFNSPNSCYLQECMLRQCFILQETWHTTILKISGSVRAWEIRSKFSAQPSQYRDKQIWIFQHCKTHCWNTANKHLGLESSRLMAAYSIPLLTFSSFRCFYF